MSKQVRDLIDLERGASMVEMALIIALVALMGTASLGTVANSIKAQACIAGQQIGGGGGDDGDVAGASIGNDGCDNPDNP
jgi:Flp pilus assembly pilin Flp